MEFQIQRKVLKVKDPDGNIHSVRFPTIGESTDFSDTYEGAEGNKKKFDLALTFLENLGLPIELSKGLDVGTLAQIIDIISGKKKD